MDKLRITHHKTSFDAIAQYIENEQGEQVEIWFARDLQAVLGYARWENFVVAIKRAIESCNTQNINVHDHFREVTKMIELGKGGKREVDDYMLTRFACYLIAQNGDPKKEEIAFAQSYFAIQTRKVELIEERLNLKSRLETRDKLRAAEKQLSQNIYERGVDDSGFARIRSKGDTALFGGYTTEDMKQRLGVKSTRPLADFLPTPAMPLPFPKKIFHTRHKFSLDHRPRLRTLPRRLSTNANDARHSPQHSYARRRPRHRYRNVRADLCVCLLRCPRYKRSALCLRSGIRACQSAT